MTKDVVVGWHHRLDGCGYGWTPGVGDGQGGLPCCGSRGHKELDMTERLKELLLNELILKLNDPVMYSFLCVFHFCCC